MPDYGEDYGEDYSEDYSEDYGEDYSEAARTRRPLSLARPAPPPQRPTDRPVTQTQLQMAIAGVNRSITKNSTAIASVNHTVGRIGNDVRQLRKESTTTRRDIGTLRDAVVLTPLLASTFSGTGSNPLLGALLPMMMVGSIGDSGSASSGSMFGGGGGGGDSMMMMMMVLALSGAIK